MKLLSTLVFTLVLGSVIAQTKFTLSGYVKDKASGETLIGANIVNVANMSQGVTTNTYGFYSMTLEAGTYKVGFSYLGYENQFFEVELTKNVSLNVDLSEGVMIEEIIISADKDERRKNVEGTQMGTVELPVENIKIFLPSSAK